MKRSKRPRRFIAGACCPNCGNYDSLYFVDETDKSFACIDCDYHSSAMREQPNQTETQRVRIVESKKKTKH